MGSRKRKQTEPDNERSQVQRSLPAITSNSSRSSSTGTAAGIHAEQQASSSQISQLDDRSNIITTDDDLRLQQSSSTAVSINSGNETAIDAAERKKAEQDERRRVQNRESSQRYRDSEDQKKKTKAGEISRLQALVLQHEKTIDEQNAELKHIHEFYRAKIDDLNIESHYADEALREAEEQHEMTQIYYGERVRDTEEAKYAAVSKLELMAIRGNMLVSRVKGVCDDNLASRILSSKPEHEQVHDSPEFLVKLEEQQQAQVPVATNGPQLQAIPPTPKVGNFFINAFSFNSTDDCMQEFGIEAADVLLSAAYNDNCAERIDSGGVGTMQVSFDNMRLQDGSPRLPSPGTHEQRVQGGVDFDRTLHSGSPCA